MDRVDDIAGGVVRHAGAAAMRQDVDWAVVRPGILALADHPGGATALRTAIKRVNEPDVPIILRSWFDQLAEEQRRVARRANRPAETGLGPVQNTLMALSGAAVIAGLGGTIAPAVAAITFVALAAGAATAWLGRMKVLEQGDLYEDRAKALNSLAKVCDDL
jgi:hypothetical protein